MLLLAPDLLGESLALKLTSARDDWEVVLRPERLTGAPALVIWSIDRMASLASVQQELFALQERWQPAPVLLLLPSDIRLSREQLLGLPAAGLLQNIDVQDLQNAIDTLLKGGRDIRLEAPSEAEGQEQTMGLGQWLLVSGLQQVSRDLELVEAMLNPPPEHPLLFALLRGRRRELRVAKGLLLWIWGPLQMGLEHAEPLVPSSPSPSQGSPSTTAISLRERNAVAVWDAIRDRIDGSVQAGLTNSTGRLLAIEGLHPDRRRELLLALLQQLDQVLQRLRSRQDGMAMAQAWDALQPELRQQALTALAGSYVQIPCNGELQPVVASLLSRADLSGEDGELPDPTGMLAPLVSDQPMLVNGLLLPADDPRAFLQLETLVSNWLVRTAELIGAELLDACGDWPELRRYLLRDPLLATRELDRLRNRLNTQLRWADWVERPIQLYESQRTLFQLRSGRIEPLLLTEPRDKELNQLGWWQRQVALLLEARDALAPQVQALVRRIGDLAVILLTQVLGRAIGLVGRGIAQGMGRSLGRS
ncbi:chemotaxis protein CheY [Synechococcus sp. KORDI-52]|uniref:DUF3685 domain-containing protein n=1 Tax=Synechococcus sp. KORDI-52 TaxID=585425 RepID=UPI0004E0543D|nr:DUF3685 domain-containing protein [Synechococcus sp. KORDI-52]AII48882.1 chemotaxis protein CheY [Synechococcus sp. KORDI-52]